MTGTNLALACGGAAGAGAGAGGRVEPGAGVGLVEQAATKMTAARLPMCLCRSQTRMHLPYQNLGGCGRGDALATGRSESYGVALTQWACALERDLTAGDEQVQVGRRG